MDRRTYNRRKKQFEDLKLKTNSDIARELNWNTGQVTMYVKRGLLPGPLGYVGKSPVWMEETINPYIKEFLSRGGSAGD